MYMNIITQEMKTLDWSQLNDRPISIGRNGTIKTSGLEIYLGGDDIYIFPLTSRGYVANCSIAVPKSEINNLIKILKTF